MRRWMVIFLLVLLPLQSSWAAIAVYCAHEPDAQAQHLGHHEHAHAGHAGADPGPETAGPNEPSGPNNPPALDFDCGHCHSSCCSLPAPMAELAPPGVAAHPAAPLLGSVRTLAQTPPERPQWARFA